MNKNLFIAGFPAYTCSSPNFGRFIYDGDGSSFGVEGPPGSAAIEQFFEGYYTEQGLEFEPTQFDGRSDYFAFIQNGIPAGGLFTGAEGIKTPEQVAMYGGIAGEQFDPCYHLACDDYDNINLDVLEENLHATASAILHFMNADFSEDCRSIDGKKACENAGCTWNKKGADAKEMALVDPDSDETHPYKVPSKKCSSPSSELSAIKTKVEGAEGMKQPNSGSYSMLSASWATSIIAIVMLWSAQL